MTQARKPMTKAQVAKHFAETFGMPRAMAADVLQELVDLAVRETQEVGVFSIPGIGKLRCAERKARMGRNPRTGEPVQIPAKTVVKIRLSKTFKDAVSPPK